MKGLLSYSRILFGGNDDDPLALQLCEYLLNRAERFLCAVANPEIVQGHYPLKNVLPKEGLNHLAGTSLVGPEDSASA